jgi:hypothetical protein
MAATSYNLHIGQNQVKWSIDAIVLKKVKLVCYTCVQRRSCAVLGLVSISWYASFTKKQGGICLHPKVARFEISEVKGWKCQFSANP